MLGQGWARAQHRRCGRANQAEATGNLQRYFALPAFALATADAGTAYKTATITRTLALTPDYWLDLTRVASRDGKPHRFDWIYHNPARSRRARPCAVHRVSKVEWYDYLKDTRASATNSDWQAVWDLSGVGQAYGSVYRNNEFPATLTLARQDNLLAGQLSYDFMNANDYAVYPTKNLDGVPNETPTQMSARVYGDSSTIGSYSGLWTPPAKNSPKSSARSVGRVGRRSR